MERKPPESFQSLIDGWIKESDRGCVLIAAAYLENVLETLLRRYFSGDTNCVKKAVEPLFQIMGPLSSFSAKIKLVFALQLVDDDQYHDLEIVRKIRNMFAHSFEEASFSSQEIADQISSITSYDRAAQNVNLEDFTSSADNPDGTLIEIHKEKLRFLIAVADLIGFLHGTNEAIAQNAR